MYKRQILLLVVTGVLAGILSGLVGVGGGIIIVPMLLMVGFSQKLAQGTSLGVLLLPVGILAVIQYYKAGYVDVKALIIIALTFVVGSYFGSKFAIGLPQETLKKIFAIILLLIGIKMLFFDKPKSSSQTTTTAVTHVESSLTDK